MPKMKTRSGAAKRFKKTASGKIKYKHSFKGHILEKKTAKRKRNLRKKGMIDKADEKRINSML